MRSLPTPRQLSEGVDQRSGTVRHKGISGCDRHMPFGPEVLVLVTDGLLYLQERLLSDWSSVGAVPEQPLEGVSLM